MKGVVMCSPRFRCPALFIPLLFSVLIGCCLFAMPAHASTIVASGACGEDAAWQLDSGGILTVSGTGSMDDYQSASLTPWNDFREHIKEVVVRDGIASVGSYAFSEIDSIVTVRMEGAATIGAYAFCGCSGLSVVDAPKVLACKMFAFFETGITELSMPSLVTVDSSAFGNCQSLESVGMPELVSAERAFVGCGRLTAVDLPKLQRAPGLFADCTSLVTASLPSLVALEDTFDGCTSLETFEIPSRCAEISGSNPFAGCSSLRSIDIADGNGSVVVEGGVLYDAPKATLICYLPNNEAASFTIPSSVTAIAASAFYGNSHIRTVTIPDSCTSIGGNAFSYSTLETVKLPATLNQALNAFSECASLASIDIPAGATYVDMSGCAALKSITIPASVTSLGSFTGCAALESIAFEEGSHITNIPGGCFRGCVNLLGISIPEGVTSIESYAFSDCTSLRAVALPSTLSSIGSDYTFANCRHMQAFTVAPGNAAFCAEDGILYTHDKKTLIACPGGKRKVVVPSGVTTISPYAFFGASGMTDIVLPAGLTTIGDCAFMGCQSLATLVIPEGVKSLPSQMLSNSDLFSMDSLYVPASVTSLGGAYRVKDVYFMGAAPSDFYYDWQWYSTFHYLADANGWSGDLSTNNSGETTWKGVRAEAWDGVVNQPQVKAGGVCGSGAYWSLFQDGELVVSGSGALSGTEEGVPWASYAGAIVKASIGSGITEIGPGAFTACSSLGSVAFDGVPPKMVAAGRVNASFPAKTVLTYQLGASGWDDDTCYDAAGGTWAGYALRAPSLPVLVSAKLENATVNTGLAYGFEYQADPLTVLDAEGNDISELVAISISGGANPVSYSEASRSVLVPINASAGEHNIHIEPIGGCCAGQAIDVTLTVNRVYQQPTSGGTSAGAIGVSPAGNTVTVHGAASNDVVVPLTIFDEFHDPMVPAAVDFDLEQYGIDFDLEKCQYIVHPNAVAGTYSFTVSGHRVGGDYVGVIVQARVEIEVRRDASCVWDIGLSGGDARVDLVQGFDAAATVPYTVNVIDQYGDAMSADVAWSVLDSFGRDATKAFSFGSDGKLTASAAAWDACSVDCGETFTVRVRAEGTHADLPIIIRKSDHMAGSGMQENVIEATCTQAGSYDEVTYCRFCDKELSRESKVVAARGHDWGDWSLVEAATCEMSGSERRVCARDPLHVETRDIESTGHTLVEAVGAAPTCEEAGEAAYWKCPVCGKLFSDAEGTSETTVESLTLPALGHEFVVADVVEPTDDEGGYVLSRCSRCGEERISDRTDSLRVQADKAAAAAVDAAIAALPAKDDLTLSDAEKVGAARASYDALTVAQKELVIGGEALKAAEARIAELQPTPPVDPDPQPQPQPESGQSNVDAEAARAVDDAISSLPSLEKLDASDAVVVGDARRLYDSLTDNQKALVVGLGALQAAERRITELQDEAETRAADERAAARVDDLITGIGVVALGSRESIEFAESAYASLTDAQRTLVTGYDALVFARASYDALVAADIANDAASDQDNASSGDSTRQGEGADMSGASVTASISIAGATIVRGLSSTPTLTVNAITTFEGVSIPVTTIAAKAFKGTSAKKLVIGNSVRAIGSLAFANAKNLTTARIGKNVSVVGKAAFKGDKKLKTITVKSFKLTKKTCKNMLKGSSVKTVKLIGMTKAQKKRALKKYREWFPATISGRRLVIK